MSTFHVLFVRGDYITRLFWCDLNNITVKIQLSACAELHDAVAVVCGCGRRTLGTSGYELYFYRGDGHRRRNAN